MPPDMNTKVTLGGGFELAVLTRVSDPFVFGLDVSLEIVPGLGLVLTLSAVISHPLVLRLNVEEQILFGCITRTTLRAFSYLSII